MLNEYFSSQSVVNDINKTLPPRIDTNNELNFITISEQEVKDVLDNLKSSLTEGRRVRAV